MLIGECEIQKEFEVKCDQLKSDTFFSIDVENLRGKDYLHDAKIVHGHMAIPHEDETFDEFVFLSVAIKANHILSDRKHKKEFHIKRNSIFIVDPLVTHWMYPTYGILNQMNKKDCQFVLCQWEIPRKNAIRKVRQIMKKLNAEWNIAGMSGHTVKYLPAQYKKELKDLGL